MFLDELRPLLIYLAVGIVFTAFLALVSGNGTEPGRATYWDGGDEGSQAADAWDRVQGDSLADADPSLTTSAAPKKEVGLNTKITELK